MKQITFFKFLMVLCLSIISLDAVAQDRPQVFGRKVQSINPKSGLTKCVSSEYESFLQEQDPKRATDQEFEEWIAPKVADIKSKLLANRNIQGTSAVVTIPVVIHVIHNGDAVGSNENISDARILSQITVLNQDFRKMLGTPGHNTNPIGADVEMEFCVAKRDPNGNATTGIVRVNKGVADWSTSNSVQTMKTSTQWDPTRYFNIWVVQFTTNTNLELGGVGGYAQFPENSGLSGLEPPYTANTDGVVIDWRAFGSSTYVTGNYFDKIDKGRTTTHEIGHAFGLRHIWGDAGNRESGVNCTGTDYCADTPNAGWENYDCLAVYNSCPEAGNDMTQNYMDYTNDACLNLFTVDQKARILAVLQNSPRRRTLTTSNACQPPLSNPSFELLQGIKLYPNPTNEILNIAVPDNMVPDSYTIYNSLGQTIEQVRSVSESNLKLNTSNYAAGIYMIRFTKDSQSKTLQFIKN